MDPLVQKALDAIAAAEQAVRAMPRAEISPQHARDIEAVMALPENQDGADKSWIWPAYEFCRKHFADARPH